MYIQVAVPIGRKNAILVLEYNDDEHRGQAEAITITSKQCVMHYTSSIIYVYLYTGTCMYVVPVAGIVHYIS